MDGFSEALRAANEWLWGAPLLGALVGFGAVMTIRLRGIQFRRLGEALSGLFHGEEDAAGETSPFGALCTALAATIGTGNIVGVATAICAGGPGALFWMVLAALLGMATQYAEGFLAVRYRVRGEGGVMLGGPFLYIERGLGPRWRPMARLFAVCAVFAGLCGVGTVAQSSSIVSAVQGFFEPSFRPGGTSGLPLFSRRYAWSGVIAGLLVTAAAAAVLLGGAKRIMRAAEFVVPFMAVGYCALGLLLLLCNLDRLPGALALVVRGAFNPRAAAGGAAGSMWIALQKGVARGVFTNEAGMGTAAIAAASAKTRSPVRQGLVAMSGTFIDTVVLCTLTGLSIVLTGAWDAGADGAAVTGLAFARGLPFPPSLSSFLLMTSLIFFAFATILGWHFYAERCLRYLTGGSERAARRYRALYLLAVLLGPYLPFEAVWELADLTNALMILPNLAALIALSGQVVLGTRAHSSKRRAGANPSRVRYPDW